MIIVTGSNGFIAGRLIKRFEESPESYDILQVDTHNKDYLFSMSDDTWRSVTKIYHFGAISDTTCTDVDLIYKNNVEYSIRLFTIASRYNIPVVYASSASVLGNTQNHINPLNYYAMSKAMVDMWVKDNMVAFKSIVGLRFFNVYGEGEEHKGDQASPLTKFTKQAIDVGEIKVFDIPSHMKRDFVWVEDCIDCALTFKASGIYDVGTSEPISFLEVAELIAKKYGAAVKTIPFPSHLKDKYQFSTCAKKHFPSKKFKTVGEYVDEL